jgi:hypothetical protein
LCPGMCCSSVPILHGLPPHRIDRRRLTVSEPRAACAPPFPCRSAAQRDRVGFGQSSRSSCWSRFASFPHLTNVCPGLSTKTLTQGMFLDAHFLPACADNPCCWYISRRIQYCPLRTSGSSPPNALKAAVDFKPTSLRLRGLCLCLPTRASRRPIGWLQGPDSRIRCQALCHPSVGRHHACVGFLEVGRARRCTSRSSTRHALAAPLR